MAEVALCRRDFFRSLPLMPLAMISEEASALGDPYVATPQRVVAAMNKALTMFGRKPIWPGDKLCVGADVRSYKFDPYDHSRDYVFIQGIKTANNIA